MTDCCDGRNYSAAGEVQTAIPGVSSAVQQVIHIIRAGLAVGACLTVTLAGAQSTNPFPDMPVDAATLRVQNQAEEVFQRTDYDRAFFIYRNELVPIGDKYGQYMVGFMYLTGKGVEEDRVMASAWYRLAAERGTREFIRARDQVMATFDEAQRAESDRLFIELRKQYGDLVLLARAIRKDYEELRGRTGSRLSADSSPVAVVDMSTTGVARSGSEYYGRIERRMKARLEYIAKHAEVGIIDIDVENVENMDIDAIERQVAAHLSQIR
jgi:hypothetical protein